MFRRFHSQYLTYLLHSFVFLYFYFKINMSASFVIVFLVLYETIWDLEFVCRLWGFRLFQNCQQILYVSRKQKYNYQIACSFLIMSYLILLQLNNKANNKTKNVCTHLLVLFQVKILNFLINLLRILEEVGSGEHL